MSLFHDPRSFVKRAPAGTPTLGQFVSTLTPRGALPVAAAVIAQPAGSAMTATFPNAANEARIEQLSDSTQSAEA